jgi:hypothetical protein
MNTGNYLAILIISLNKALKTMKMNKKDIDRLNTLWSVNFKEEIKKYSVKYKDTLPKDN